MIYILILLFLISGILWSDSVLIISMLLLFAFGWVVIIALNIDSSKKKRVRRQLYRERLSTDEQGAELGVDTDKTLKFNI